jgi:hypothetical protein
MGAGAEEISRLVAYRLGFFFDDEQIVRRAAELGGIDAEAVADEERRKPLIAGLLETMAADDSSLDLPPPVWDEPRSDVVRSLIRDAIREVAERATRSSLRMPPPTWSGPVRTCFASW